MSSPVGIERCLSFINTQLRNGRTEQGIEDNRSIRAVTISRQVGCGAAAAVGKLGDYLQARMPENEPLDRV